MKKNPYEDLLDLFAALDGFEAAIEQAREEFERLQEITENEKEEN